MAFEPVEKWVEKHQMVCSFEGQEATMKTSLALTAPGPIGFVNLERGLDRAKKPDRTDVSVASYNFRRDIDDASEQAERVWKELKTDIHHSLDVNRTTVVDTADILYECIRLAILGALERKKSREYGPVNRAMNDIFDHAYDTGNHLVMIHPLREIYANDKGTGVFGPKGWPETVYRVNQRFRFEYEDVPEVCVLKPKEIVTTIKEPDFVSLALTVFPYSDEEEWTE